MRKLAFIGIILQPSVASFMTALTLSSLLFVSVFLGLGNSGTSFYELLFGPASTPELISSTRSTFDSLSQSFFGNPLINNVLFFGFWLLIGLVAYAFVSGTGATIGAAHQLVEEEKMIHAHKQNLEKELITRLVLRAAALLAWVLYMVVFLRLFLPFAMLSFQVATQASFSVSSVYTTALGYLVIFTSLHLHVVLLRCLLLRPRVIGGWDDVIAAKLT